MEGVGANEAKDIEKIVSRILNDLGNPEPPITLSHVRDLLSLDLKYYDTRDPSTIDEVVHKMKVAGKQIIARPTLIMDAIKKANISALWVPDSKRIMIDQKVPTLKHRWIEGHEIGHSLIPWHRDFLFGDDEFTLDPACHAIVESEANYAASQLLFLQGRFVKETRDLALNFKNIRATASRYGNTITSTLWRVVQDRDPSLPIFGMISQHPNRPEQGGQGVDQPWKHFVRSAAFKAQFHNIVPAEIYDLLAQHANWAKGGTIIDCSCQLLDANGELRDFRIESFSNNHGLLTYGVPI